MDPVTDRLGLIAFLLCGCSIVGLLVSLPMDFIAPHAPLHAVVPIACIAGSVGAYAGFRCWRRLRP